MPRNTLDSQGRMEEGEDGGASKLKGKKKNSFAKPILYKTEEGKSDCKYSPPPIINNINHNSDGSSIVSNVTYSSNNSNSTISQYRIEGEVKEINLNIHKTLSPSPSTFSSFYVSSATPTPSTFSSIRASTSETPTTQTPTTQTPNSQTTIASGDYGNGSEDYEGIFAEKSSIQFAVKDYMSWLSRNGQFPNQESTLLYFIQDHSSSDGDAGLFKWSCIKLYLKQKYGLDCDGWVLVEMLLQKYLKDFYHKKLPTLRLSDPNKSNVKYGKHAIRRSGSSILAERGELQSWGPVMQFGRKSSGK